MSRTARTITPGAVHHVISRFVDRDWLFRGVRERGVYLDMLARALERSDWRCLAYCLMSNHIHFAMVAGELPLDSWVRRVNSPFANWMNERYKRLGPVFASRPSASCVPPHREPRLLAYIHNNPVRAGVVTFARESTWSSHRSYLAPETAPPWLHVREGLERTGCADDPKRFDERVVAGVDDDWREPDVSRVRTAARKLDAFEIGTPELSDPIAFPVVARPFVAPRPSVVSVVKAVCSVMGLDSRAIAARHSRGTASSAKRVVVHAATRFGISASDAAASVGVSRQRGSVLRAMELARACADSQVMSRTARVIVPGAVPAAQFERMNESGKRQLARIRPKRGSFKLAASEDPCCERRSLEADEAKVLERVLVALGDC